MVSLIQAGLILTCFKFILMADVETIWNDRAQAELKNALGLRFNTNTAKNVILFLGDGMGVTTVSAARLYRAQLTKVEEGTSTLEFEKFPYVALSKTYNTDKQTPDSAGTATAFLCGIKANAATVGVNSNVPRGDCSKEANNKVNSIFHWSIEAGKSTGIVTTSRVTHATPAAAYAHSAERNWESDADMDGVVGGCTDIAKQLIEDNPSIDVVLGGGRKQFLPTSKGGVRKDNLDLIEKWSKHLTDKGRNATYVKTQTELNMVDYSKTDNLLGLFAMSHLDYSLDRMINNNSINQPSLADMTHSAIQILKKNSKGFFLLVEGARIDHAHHENQPHRALHDTLAFDDAVATALRETDEKDTLLVVTADHSHVFSMAGYPETGNDIFGVVNPVDEGTGAYDNMPFASLTYGNGPGGWLENKTDLSGLQRRNLTNVDTSKPEFRFPSGVWMSYETHAAEDVGIFSHGPMSHLFHGVHEQNYIAHVMAYASCVGANKGHCDKPPVTNPPMTDCSANDSPKQVTANFVIVSILVFICIQIFYMA